MASHNITIAKASFTAACLRPDATHLTRDEIANFHVFLETAVSKCSPQNVQSCKDWLSKNVSCSLQRSTALGKYLLAFSKQVKDEDGLVRQEKSPATRRRLHILYILNDLLHHERYHTSKQSSERYLEKGIEPRLIELFQMVKHEAKRRVGRRLETLLDTWEHEEYFEKAVLAQLRQSITNHDAKLDPTSVVSISTSPVRETPYIMPALHGDPTIPYYDLPAANLMPHIVPNKPTPMRPDHIRALQLSAGPADESLVNAVKDFLKDIERMDNPYEKLEEDNVIADLDELGQLSYRNEADEIVGDTYYGWSREFCDRMRKRRKEEKSGESRGRSRSLSRSRSSSRSRSRSFSRSPPKRRRYESLSRSHSRSRRSRSRSGSPQRQTIGFQQARPPQMAFQQTPSTMMTPGVNDGLYPPIPLGPNGLPLPPPRPPNYNGPWPPPPPPPTSSMPNMPFPRPPPFYHGSNIPPPPDYQARQR